MYGPFRNANMKNTFIGCDKKKKKENERLMRIFLTSDSKRLFWDLDSMIDVLQIKHCRSDLLSIAMRSQLMPPNEQIKLTIILNLLEYECFFFPDNNGAKN